jgi:hypothetical protein
MWRKLLRVAHPDSTGSHELFIWTRAFFEHVAGTSIPEDPPRLRRDPPKHKRTGDRVDFHLAYEYDSHEQLTEHAVAMAEETREPYASLLEHLRDCYPSVPSDYTLRRAENIGATYKQLAYIDHLANLSDTRRMARYRLAEEVPLSQRHAGHILQSYEEPTIVKPTQSQAEPVAVHEEGGGG